MDTVIEIFNTINLNDFYEFISNITIDTILSHWEILLLIGIVIGLLYTPYKSYVGTVLFYCVVIGAGFFSIAIFKNSNFSPNESFVFFSVGLVIILGVCLFKFFL